MLAWRYSHHTTENAQQPTQTQPRKKLGFVIFAPLQKQSRYKQSLTLLQTCKQACLVNWLRCKEKCLLQCERTPSNDGHTSADILDLDLTVSQLLAQFPKTNLKLNVTDYARFSLVLRHPVCVDAVKAMMTKGVKDSRADIELNKAQEKDTLDPWTAFAKAFNGSPGCVVLVHPEEDCPKCGYLRF
jgi:hypothetical protein